MFTVQPFPVNPLSENCYVVSDETREAVIIDCGALFSEERAAIVEYISHEQLKPVAHLLTHGHFDHLWGAAYLHDLYGLAARCPQGDRALFDDAPSQMRDILGHAMPCPTGPAGEDILPDSTITFGSHALTVIATPGHTPGGVCFYCEAEHVLFSGDSLFQMSIGRTDFPGGNHWELIAALKHLLRDLPDNTVIYPGHGPKTTAAYERQYNPYLSFS